MAAAKKKTAAKAKKKTTAKAKKTTVAAATTAPVVPNAPLSTPAELYGGMVAEIINSRPRESTFKPKLLLNLSITRRRQPSNVSELHRDEREQLTAVFGANLGDELKKPEHSIEVAEVVDEKGVLRFRLYAWNYGVGYLFAPKGVDVIGFGSQHDIEHWSLPQRDIFFAMDRALRKKGHGFQQPLSFCWWDDTCWDEIAKEKVRRATLN